MATETIDSVVYDPNAEATGAMLPGSGNSAGTMEAYVSYFENGLATTKSTLDLVIEKAISAPPKSYTFARMTTIPDPSNSSTIPWPGIAPEALQKVAKENLAPQMIIGMRVDDVLGYTTMATQPWRRGWKFEGIAGDQTVSDSDRKDMREAEEFLNNSNIETTNSTARERDEMQLTDFQRFIAAIVRDSLTYDGIAIWTDADDNGKVRGYKAMPAGNIRLCQPTGYNQDPKSFAVLVDEGGSIVQSFSRNELIWYVRNPRTDAVVAGYGYSELEIGVRLIQGFQNAVDLNCDTFNRSSIPNGILVLKGGGWVQKQVDVLSRIWGNLKKGITKAWALPVIATPKDGELEIIDLQDLKGTDVRYDNHMNMMIGAFCTVFRFPVRRLGYRISGKGKDTEPDSESSTNLIDDDDPGRKPLLVHLENVINQYLIWPRWPGIRFNFTGKDPKEDARQYEALQNARTWKESRAEAGLPTLASTVPEKLKELAEIMEMCPVDPNKSGVFQTLVSTFMSAQAETEQAKQPGNTMQSKKDPAASEKHGHLSGVRRDSARETKSAAE